MSVNIWCVCVDVVQSLDGVGLFCATWSIFRRGSARCTLRLVVPVAARCEVCPSWLYLTPSLSTLSHTLNTKQLLHL